MPVSLNRLWLVPIVLDPALGAYAGLRGPQKFQNFLPLQSRHTVSPVSDLVCNATLAEYRSAWESASLNRLDQACLDQEICILDNMSEAAKAYMATSSLLLGLSPILFSTFGPTISEVGLLSLNRPLLATFVSLGTVGVYPSRVLSYIDDSPLDVLGRSTSLPPGIFSTLLSDTRMAATVSAVEYLLVASAVFNVCWTSWELGVATVSNFICQSSYMPIIWTALPIVVHLPAAGAMHVALRHRAAPGPRGLLRALLSSETKLSLAQKAIPTAALAPRPHVLAWRWLADMFSFAHVLIGIFIYSSLLFTMTPDAALVLFRYYVSAFVCRLVLAFELAGLRWSQSSAEESSLRQQE